jgi:hypothetical protein
VVPRYFFMIFTPSLSFPGGGLSAVTFMIVRDTPGGYRGNT